MRNQHYLYQLHVSHKIKTEANESYHQGNFDEALHRYEESLSIFRYMTSKSFSNMKDEDLSYHEAIPSDPYEAKHKRHLIALYLNISSCLAKLNRK